MKFQDIHIVILIYRLINNKIYSIKKWMITLFSLEIWGMTFYLKLET